MGISVMDIGNKSVIVVDCGNMDSSESKEITDILEQASELVANNPKKSVYIITDVTNLRFNNDVIGAFKKYAAANTDYVKESVIVGLSGFQNVIFSAIKALTKREYRLVGTMDDAVKYMSSI